MFEVHQFSQFAGSAKAVAQSKADLLQSKCVAVVGDVRTGKSSFLRCLQRCFAGSAVFFELSKSVESEADFTRSVENFFRRKVCVTKLCNPAAAADDDTLPRYVVIDDLDILLAFNASAIMTSIAAMIKLGCRFVLSMDKDSVRKFKLKKESLMLYLDDTLDAATMKRWVKQWFPDVLTDAESEAGFVRAMAAAAASEGVVKDMLNHFHVTPGIPRSERGIQWDREGNYKSIENIYTRELTFEEAYRAAESAGGSMLWQIASQNATLFLGARKRQDYMARMDRTICGAFLEVQGHMGKERHANCIGIAIAILAWSNLTKKVDLRKLVYSKAIGNGGARALEKKNIAAKAVTNGLTLCEMAWVTSQ
jgi:hypothetical protein